MHVREADKTFPPVVFSGGNTTWGGLQSYILDNSWLGNGVNLYSEQLFAYPKLEVKDWVSQSNGKVTELCFAFASMALNYFVCALFDWKAECLPRYVLTFEFEPGPPYVNLGIVL